MVLSKDIKFAICFGLIIGALFSFCNLCFASEIEDVTFNSISNIGFTADGRVVTSSGSTGYITIEPGYIYHFKNNLNSNNRFVGFSNELIEIGDVLSDVSIIQAQETFDFSYSQFSYVYFNVNSTSSVTLTREPLLGMSGTIDNLAYVLSFNSLWQIVGFVVPILGIAILLALGFYLINRIINKIKRKKGGI